MGAKTKLLKGATTKVAGAKTVPGTKVTNLDIPGQGPVGNAAQDARYQALGDQVSETTPPAARGRTRPAAGKEPWDLPVNDSARPATPTEPTTPAPDPPSRSLPSIDAGSGGIGGIALGLVGTAVLVNFMRGGTAGVRAWFAAKFLNITSAPAGKFGKVSTTTATAGATLPGTSPWGSW